MFWFCVYYAAIIKRLDPLVRQRTAANTTTLLTRLVFITLKSYLSTNPTH